MEQKNMVGMALDDLGQLQKAVMEIVWELGEATVNEVRERLGRQKLPAYTTVLSVMQKLEKAGWLEHREAGRAYVYRATHSRDEVGRGSLRKFVERVFGGDSLQAFQHLLNDEELKADDLAELRKMIEQRRRQLRND